MAHERGRADLRQQVGDADLDVGMELSRTGNERVRAGHLGGDLELEDRHLPGLGQAPGDRAPDARQRDLLGLALRHGGRLGGDRCAGRGAVEVLGDDAAVRAGPGDRRELDAALPGNPAREWRGLDALARLRRLGRLRSGLWRLSGGLGLRLLRLCGPGLLGGRRRDLAVA